MGITRRTFLATGAAATAIATEQLFRPGVLNAQTDKVLNVYSARHYDNDRKLYEGFQKSTGIKVNWVEADADKLIERMRSEGNNSPADILLTVDAGRLWRAQEAGLLMPVRSNLLTSAIPASVREPAGHWYGISKRARVLIYNKDKVNPRQLSTYEDLASGKWKGKLVSRSSTHVYNQSLLGAIIAASGEKGAAAWAKGIVGNLASQPEGNDTAQIRLVASGKADLTFVNHYYLVRLAESSKPEDKAIASKVGLFFPNQRLRGTHINISGAGVVKTAKNRAAAVRFLEYMVGREAQDLLARGNNEYPVVGSTPLDPIVARYGRFVEDRVNAAVFGRNNGLALRIADQAGWK
jgi:iron(III) transport system substrate-binding protein